MKKYLLIIAAGCIGLITSCKGKNEGGMSDKAKKNLEVAQAVNKMFESGDITKIGDYMNTDAVDHSGMKGDIVGLDSIKATFKMYMDMMGDMKNETTQEIANDDYVFQWQKENWTMKKDGMGMKAGQKGSMDAIEVSKFKDGKVSEHWGFIGFPDMMKMMNDAMSANTMNNNNNMPAKDSTK